MPDDDGRDKYMKEAGLFIPHRYKTLQQECSTKNDEVKACGLFSKALSLRKQLVEFAPILRTVS